MSKDIEITDYFLYVANENETFDLIAYMQYGNEQMADLIIGENPDYADVLMFEGGEELYVPVIDVREIEDSLPPWRKGETDEDSV